MNPVPTTMQELLVIALVLSGAVGWELLRTRGRHRLALGCFVACTVMACVLAERWNIVAGL